MEKALFLGNGINRITSTYDWQNLLKDLIKSAQVNIEIGQKPFPLIYEELYFRLVKETSMDESLLLEIIVERMGEMKPNIFHEIIMKSSMKHIITTNYDYTLEHVLLKQHHKVQTLNSISKYVERKYRLTTYNLIENKHIWHIHGDIQTPKSIVLGQSNYAKTLSRVNQYIEAKEFQPQSHNSWIDLMLACDVHMIGFGLGYFEMDLWLVLNERVRYFQQHLNETPNRIVYYMYLFDKQDTKDLESLLDSFQVEVVKSKNHEGLEEFYERSIELVIV